MDAQLQVIHDTALEPAAAMLPAIFDSWRARALLLAIGLQESGFMYRRQMNNGPAKGFWQFEQGGGVKGVMNHSVSKPFAQKVCYELGVPYTTKAAWDKLEKDDVFAAVFARLLLLTDPIPLSVLDDRDQAWEMYANRCWRPGKPHPDKWPRNHKLGYDFMKRIQNGNA